MDVFKTLLLDTPDSLSAITGTLQIANGGTGATDAAGARDNLLPDYTGNVGKVLTVNAGATDVEWTTNGAGTVTSVDVSGGTTGLTTSGGPVTSSGTITLAGTLAVANGGTGASTASDARVNLLPSYTANGTKILALNAGATDVEWVAKPTGTVTSVDLSAGTGISVTGGPITSSGSITVTNTAPDQTVVLTAGTGISTSGTYPSFTVTNSAPDQTVAIAAGTGISVSGSYPSFTVTNSAPSLGGDVVGPASSTDNAVVRFDSTTGKLVQNSGVTISDADLLTTTDLTVNDDTVLGSSNSDTVNFNARVASDLVPSTDNTFDLGIVGHEWRDLRIDGTANIDSLVADTADINGGTIDATAIGDSSTSTGKFTTLSSSGNTFLATANTNTDPVASRANGLCVTSAAIYMRNGLTMKWGLAGNGDHVLFFSDNGSAAVQGGGINTTGSTTAFNTTSDARLKTNVREISNSGSLIDAIRPVLHDWKTGESESYGFLAQELVQVFPRAVTPGDSDSEVTKPWGVDMSKLIPVLVAEIQSLRSRVEELENRNP